MIAYEQMLFGFRDLTRIHGSALYKAAVPAMMSTIFLAVLDVGVDAPKPLVVDGQLAVMPLMGHPYAVGAIVVFFSFLLTFRLNFAYGRYMEGATAVHLMVSKWLDCAMTLASFHYQSNQFFNIKPPTYGEKSNNIRKTPIIAGAASAITEAGCRERSFELAYMHYMQSAQNLKEQEQRNSLGSRAKRIFTLGMSGRYKRTRSDPSMRTRHSNDRGKRIFLSEFEEQQQRYYDDQHQQDDQNSSNDGGEQKTTPSGGRRIPVPLRFQQNFVRAASKLSLVQPPTSPSTRDDTTSAASIGGSTTDPISLSEREAPATMTSITASTSAATSGTDTALSSLSERNTSIGGVAGSTGINVSSTLTTNNSSNKGSLMRKFNIPKPSLFLEQMAHLFSLLSAVSMASLRNDNPCAEVRLDDVGKFSFVGH